MDNREFRTWSERAANWGVDYRESVRQRPVRAKLIPGETSRRLPASPPETGEPMEQIFADFEQLIVPGMTHWQHPRFFAYFQASAAPASVVAEYLVAAMGAQCMLWQTSPAATELETRVMDWLRQAVGLPEGFSGVIQDGASSSTLAAVLTMREKALGWNGNKQGLKANRQLRVYSSNLVHTSIDRAIWMSGIGADNLIRIPTEGRLQGMDIAALEAAIIADTAAGMIPAGVIACVGSTSVGSTDNVRAVCEVAKRHGLYVHVDAAWAGNAMLVPEYRGLWDGIECADSLVFNPHKWLGAQLECSAHFVRDPTSLVKTLAARPEYLKTNGVDGMIDYSEWTIQLSRRFRALKLWFVIRAEGLEGLRKMLRNHVNWSQNLAKRLGAEPDFEIASAPVLSLFSFRYVPKGASDLDALNLKLVNTINDDGRIYLTQTKFENRLVIRFQAGHSDMVAEDADVAFDTIVELARGLGGVEN